jgi:predicted O-methyltransferase YrrM
MYSRFRLAYKYLRYFLTAGGRKGHGIHSPFVFDFVTRILNDTKYYDAYDTAEGLRKKLLKDKTLLQVEDFGAGSASAKSDRRSISSIARHSLKSVKYSQLLYRMVKHYQPEVIAELGTSLGITTAYLSLANPAAKVITFEGAPAVAAKARQHFRQLNLENISVIEGNFDDTLKNVLNNVGTLDFCFMDGNHRLEPTLRYFTWIKEKLHTGSVVVVDDIRWSREMETAWRQLKEDASVRCSVDLFFTGILFFSTAFAEKQHFRIRY